MPTTFRYTPYEPANTGTIAQIMGLPAQIQAQSARNIAEATARANAAKIQQVGQTAQVISGGVNQAIGNVADILQLKKEAPIRALQAQQLLQNVEEGQGKIYDADQARQLTADIGEAFKSGANADGTIDVGKVKSFLIQKGHPEAAIHVESELANLGPTWDIKDGVLFQPKSKTGNISIVKPQEPTAGAAEQRYLDLQTKKNAGTPLTTMEQAYSDAFERAHPNAITTPPKSEKASFRLNGKDVEGDYVPGANGASGRYLYQGQDVTAQAQHIPNATQVMLNQPNVGLSDEALDQAADKYIATGLLPAGFGPAGIARQTSVMNRAAQKNPTAALARNAAVYKADSANLGNLQKTEGSLSAFENAAGKNIDQFLSLASKLTDSGVPWLNTPLRKLSDKAIGNEWLPAVQAARKIALREVARVTNDPKLSGQITDSARNDINDMANGDATIAQMLRVFPVLKQDMTNVHAGLNDEIELVKTRLGGGVAPTQNQNIIRYDMNGQVIK